MVSNRFGATSGVHLSVGVCVRGAGLCADLIAATRLSGISWSYAGACPDNEWFILTILTCVVASRIRRRLVRWWGSWRWLLADAKQALRVEIPLRLQAVFAFALLSSRAAFICMDACRHDAPSRSKMACV